MYKNGHAFKVMAGAAKQLPEPYPGPVRARISRPLLEPPDHVGRFGRAWVCDLEAVRRARSLGEAPDALLAHWIVEAPWSHQVVHSYSLMLVHLRPLSGRAPVRKFSPDATHEVCLQAIHPAAPRHRMLREPTDPRAWIEPTTFAAHIAARDDGEARGRVVHAVELVCAGRLSPHPSHARSWAELFGANILAQAAAPTVDDQ